MIVQVRMLEAEIRDALAEYLERKYGVIVETSGLNIEVKSKQNYKSEWEHAAIRLEAMVTAKTGTVI